MCDASTHIVLMPRTSCADGKKQRKLGLSALLNLGFSIRIYLLLAINYLLAVVILCKSSPLKQGE